VRRLKTRSKNSGGAAHMARVLLLPFITGHLRSLQ